MNLTINGEAKSFDSALNIAEIISILHIEGKVMAAAVNMDVVKKENWNTFTPQENDKIEFLQFVGGG